MPVFDASALPPYAVILVPEAFQDQGDPGPKRLVVIGHQAGHAICVKATSKTEPYKNNAGMMESCVFYGADDEPCFEKETVVQPDNQVPLSYDKLDEWYRKGTLEVLGELPTEEFEERLLQAADGERINERKKQRIVEMVRSNRERRA
jgi:hypothetical protein